MTIKIINSTNLRNNLADTLDEATDDKAILIRRRSETDVALVSADFLEDLLALHDKRYIKSIERARNDIKAGKTFSHEEIFGSAV